MTAYYVRSCDWSTDVCSSDLLPENVALLASTPSYAHQGFARGPNILALQCHPEMDGEGLENWLGGADVYLASAGTDAPTIRANADRLGPAAGRKGAPKMRAWLEQSRQERRRTRLNPSHSCACRKPSTTRKKQNN